MEEAGTFLRRCLEALLWKLPTQLWHKLPPSSHAAQQQRSCGRGRIAAALRAGCRVLLRLGQAGVQITALADLWLPKFAEILGGAAGDAAAEVLIHTLWRDLSAAHAASSAAAPLPLPPHVPCFLTLPTAHPPKASVCPAAWALLSEVPATPATVPMLLTLAFATSTITPIPGAAAPVIPAAVPTGGPDATATFPTPTADSARRALSVLAAHVPPRLRALAIEQAPGVRQAVFPLDDSAPTAPLSTLLELLFCPAPHLQSLAELWLHSAAAPTATAAADGAAPHADVVTGLQAVLQGPTTIATTLVDTIEATLAAVLSSRQPLAAEAAAPACRVAALVAAAATAAAPLNAPVATLSATAWQAALAVLDASVAPQARAQNNAEALTEAVRLVGVLWHCGQDAAVCAAWRAAASAGADVPRIVLLLLSGRSHASSASATLTEVCHCCPSSVYHSKGRADVRAQPVHDTALPTSTYPDAADAAHLCEIPLARLFPQLSAQPGQAWRYGSEAGRECRESSPSASQA